MHDEVSSEDSSSTSNKVARKPRKSPLKLLKKLQKQTKGIGVQRDLRSLKFLRKIALTKTFLKWVEEEKDSHWTKEDKKQVNQLLDETWNMLIEEIEAVKRDYENTSLEMIKSVKSKKEKIQREIHPSKKDQS